MSTCKPVADMSDSEVKDWVNSFDTVMTDCDGVLWTGSTAIPGSPEIINRFRELGKKVFYVTNNSTKHRNEYKTKFDKLGFGGDMEEIIGTAYLAALYLDMNGFDKTKKVYVVGSTGITQELDDVGIQYLPIGAEQSLFLNDDFTLTGVSEANLENGQVGAVVVGFTRDFNFYHIVASLKLLEDPDTLFIADCPDISFGVVDAQRKRMTAPCTGSMVAAIEVAAGRKPIVLGKPSKFMFEIVQSRHPSVQPARTLMIGDRADTDILLGKNCGLQTLLVGSGVHSLEKVREWEVSEDSEEKRQVPDKYLDCLGDLLERVKDM